MLLKPRAEIDIPYLLSQLTAAGEGAPTAEQKLELVQAMRSHSREAAQQVDEFLLTELVRLKLGLRDARDSQKALKALLDKMAMPPWHPATFLGLAETEAGPAAMVTVGGTRRVVGLGPDVDPGSLECGDEVLLSHELNVMLARSPYASFPGGETAVFDRYTDDGRLVVRSREEEIVVTGTNRLRDGLESGDHVRWDRSLWMAFETLPQSPGRHLFLEETPCETFAGIGGLEHQIEALQRSIRLHARHPDVVRKYKLARQGSVLLVGPPGTGKTMMARSLANWLARISASGRARFMSIKPGSLHSVWYSQSEANYREAFRMARDAGELQPDIPVVMFFDEVDAIGAGRGDSSMRVDDRILNAFMAELDGLESRGNILLVSATNRRDAIDPALLRPGRLGDLVLEVPRPTMSAARQIFDRHLPREIPYAADSLAGEAAAVRGQVIDSAVARIYAPNGDGDLATITFRDGKRRAIGARDLISGAVIANIARAAVEHACLREVETGEGGLRLSDLLTAIAEEFESASRALTPANCHKHLHDLPQDLAVVRVEPVERRVRRPHRYLHVA